MYKIKTSHVKATAGDSITVKFSINHPQNKHFLNKEDGTVIKSHYEILEDEVVFPQVTADDTGSYIISCRSPAGEASATFLLEVTPSKGNLALAIMMSTYE